MNIPEQLISLSQKNEQFIKDTALAFASIAKGSSSSKKNDEIAWDYYNGKIDKKKFDYLTKIGDYTMPSVMRRVSIQRPPINLLLSQFTRRPFVFSTVVADEESVKQKFQNQFRAMVKQFELKIKEQYNEFMIGYKRLLQQEQQIKQMLQQEPQSQEQAQQLAMLAQQLPEIEVAIQTAKEQFEQRLGWSKEEHEKAKQVGMYTYKDLKEILAQKGLLRLRQTHNMKEESVSFFTDKCVTGKGYYYVDYIPGSKGIVYEAVDSMQVYFPSIPGIKNIEDGSWVLIEDYISYSTLIDQYGGAKELTDEVLKKLEYYKDYSSGEDIGMGDINVYSGAKNYSNGINQKRIWWKSPRKVYIKKTPHPHKSGELFRHFIEDEPIYDKKPKSEKGEHFTTVYMYDLFHATIIDDKYIVAGHMVQEPLRRKDNYSRVQLPVIGKSYSTYSEEPYSLIWTTKDLQDLYDIVNYHRELYIAASGVKGQVIDLSQKPSWMGLKEHQYHKKLGNLYIETVDKAGRKVQSPYNQWKEFDDSLSPNIQFLEAIMASLDNTCKETMGVSRARMGQVVGTDQVGTAQMSRDQSSLVTEILYYQSDQIEARAMTRALNLIAKHVWKDETILQYITPDLKTEILKIPRNLINQSDYDIIVLNSTQEENKMQELKQLAMIQHQKGMLPFKDIINIYSQDSVAEFQKNVQRWAEEAERLAQTNFQNQEQAKIEGEKAKIRMEKEFEVMIERDKRQIEKLKTEIDQARLESEVTNNEIKAMLKHKEINADREAQLLKITSNRDVEMQYLQEQSRNNQVQEQLRGVQLQLQKLQIEINAVLGDNKNRTDAANIDKTTKDRDKNRIKN